MFTKVTEVIKAHYFSIATTLLVVPALVCVAIHFSGEELRESLTLYLSKPSIITMYTANFVHANDVHLLSNMLVYLVAGGASILLYRRMALESVLVVSLMVTIILVPYICSLGTLAYFPPNYSTKGFSGVTYAVVGILLFGLSLRMIFEKEDSSYSYWFALSLVVYYFLSLYFQGTSYPFVGYLFVVLPAAPFTLLVRKYRKDRARVKRMGLAFLLICLVSPLILFGISP
ncbi:MAG: hypothetical protein PWR09_254, partial [Archaeoglobi archaeon]|nr:hypothetical protein [Archaeoglobi archaeon]